MYYYIAGRRSVNLLVRQQKVKRMACAARDSDEYNASTSTMNGTAASKLYLNSISCTHTYIYIYISGAIYTITPTLNTTPAT